MEILKKLINILITLLALIFLFIFIVPYFFARILNIGNIAGTLICLLLIFKFGFSQQYNELKSKLNQKKSTGILLKIYSICGIIFTIYAVIISGLMIGCSMISPRETATAVVLGAKVNPNGASVALAGRIRGAEKYLRNTPKAKAVVTGGQGADEPISEAQCMYEHLTASGIDESRIFIENQATDTYENIQFSCKIIQENNLDDNLAIATDSYHQMRARIIARKQGVTTEIGAVNAITDSTIGVGIYPTYFVREWFAIPVEILK